MNKKKKLHKRLYIQGLMTNEERAQVKAEKDEERFNQKKKQNKKLQPSFGRSSFPGDNYKKN